MPRFVFITDTHLGAVNDMGYHQQPRRADQLPALLALLDGWIRGEAEGGAPISFVLHGGDMVDAAGPEILRAATETFHLSVPVYLSLGNHDLTRRDAADLWLSEAPAFFPEGEFAYALSGEGWMLHVAPTQWCEVPYYWEEVQRPYLLPKHIDALASELDAHPDVTHVLCTHGEVLGVPPEQTGRAETYHPPEASYTETIVALLRRFPQLKAVLSGHNHINTHAVREEAHLMTGSAFPETPFEFKVVDIATDHLKVRTVPLLAEVSFHAGYDWDKTFVQGRRRDREFAVEFREATLAETIP